MSKKEKKSKKKKGSAKGQKNYSGSIALSKLKHVIMKKKNKKGKKIECLVIPIDENYFVRGKDGAIYMPIRIITKEEQDEYGQNGFIVQSVDSKVWKDANEKKKEKLNKLPIIGNIKDFTSGGSSNAASGKAGKDIGEDDDLPF